MPSNNNRINFQVGYNVDQASVNAVKKSLQDLQNIKIKDFSGSKKQLDQIKETAGKVQAALTKAFNVNLNSLNTKAFNTALNQAGLNIDKIYSQFSKAGAQGQVAFSRMASSVLTTNLQLKQTNSLVSQMGETMANTVKWGIASSIMNSFSNSVQQAFQYVKSLDSALTDIRIVTGDSTEQMKQFAEQANNAAQSLGRSTMDYTKAALTFYQQGLSEEDVQVRTQTVLKAQNITGAGQEMADYLTAVWNGYKVANEEAELYVDKLAAVADSSASNMSELAVAMSKVASTANMLGVPVDNLNAQIATIVATTRQAPESVGNALKTIYSRINDIATGADDAQISLGNYSSKMAEVGINVLDANGRLRDTGDVIDEIGGKWATLSREQQIYLARTMAGQRQYNNLLALFENWGKYTDLVNVSLDAQGTTMQKNAIYMESLGAKMEQLGAAGEKVKSALINEEDLKGLVDFGTGAVNLFGNLIESIGGGRGALLAFSSIFTQVFSGTIAKQLNNTITNFQNVRNNAELLKQDIANLKTFQNAGINNQAVQSLTKYMGQLQKYYSVLDAASINNQKNLIRELDELQNSKIVLQDKKRTVEEYARSVGILDSSNIWEKETDEVLELNAAIGDLDGSAANLRELYSRFQQTGEVTDHLTESFQNFLSSYERLNPNNAEKLREAFANIEDDPSRLTFTLTRALDEAQQKARSYSQVINTAVQQQNNLNNKTAQLKNIIQNNNKNFQQLFNVTNIVNMTAALGQFASGINNIINLTKIWHNQNLSAGQKILQTFTNLGMTIPLLINSYSKLKTSLGIEKGLLQTGLLIEKQRTLEKKKQNLQTDRAILLEAKRNLIGSSDINAIKDNAKALVENGKALKDVNNSLDITKGNLISAKQSFSNLGQAAGGVLSSIGTGITAWLSNPATLAATVIGVLAVAIGVNLYNAWNKAAKAAEEATEKTKKAKQYYDNTVNSIKELNSSLNSLKSARDNLDNLTQGTLEWRNALQEVNQQVLDLVKKYPQLQVYSDNNGILNIKQDSIDSYLQKAQQYSEAQGLAYANLNKQSVEAENESKFVNYARNIDGLGGITAEEVQSVVNAVNEHGSYILEDIETLQKFTDVHLKNIDALYQNRDSLNILASQVKNNITAAQNLSLALTQSSLTGVKEYQDSQYKQLFTALYEQEASKKANFNQEKYYTEKVGSALSMSGSVGYSYQDVDINAILADWQKANPNKVKFEDNKFWEEIDGEFQQVGEQYVKLAIAYHQIITQDGKEIAKEIQQKIKSLGDQADIANAFIGDFDLYKTTKNDLNTILNTDNKDLRAFIMDQFDFTNGMQLNQQINRYKHDLEVAMSDYLASLPDSVQKAFKTLDLDNISLQTQDKVGTILKNAFVEGKGLQGLEEDVAKLFNEALSKDKLDQLLNLDFANLELQDLQTALDDLGLTSEDAEVGLKALIRTLKKGFTEDELTPEQIYNNIHSVIDKKNGKTLKQYEEISDQDYNKLKTAGVDVEGAFIQMTSGAWKFIGDAEEFYKRANQVSLDPFIGKVKELQEQIDKTKNLSFSDLEQQSYVQSSRTYRDDQGHRIKSTSIEIDTQAVQNQLNTLSGAGLLDESTLAEYNNALIASNAEADQQKEILDKIHELLITNREEIQQYLEVQRQQTIEQQHQKELQLAFSQQDLGELMDLRNSEQNPLKNLDDDQYIDALIAVADAQGLVKENIIDLAQLWAQSASEIDGVSDSLQNNAKASYDVAAVAEDLISGIEAIQKAWKDVVKQGIEPGIQELSAAKEAISDMFNQDVSSTFVQDHLDEIRRIAQGDITAVQELGNELAFLTMQNVQVPVHLTQDQFDAEISSLQTQIMNTDWGEIQIGTNIDEAPFYDALQRLIIQSGMTQQQINAILAGIGYVPDIEYVNVPLSKVEQAGTDTSYVAKGKLADGSQFTQEISEQFYNAHKTDTGITIPVIKGSKFVGGARLGSVGGNRVSGTTPKSSGGGKGGGGKSPKSSSPKSSTSKKPTQVKPQQLSEAKESIEDRSDVYHDINLALEKQEDKLDDIQDKQKKLVNRDRLENLQEQNKQLEKQKDLLDQKTGIAASELVRLRNEIIGDLGDIIKFDKNGQIANYNQALDKARDNYNDAIAEYNKKVLDAETAYNKYVDQYNQMSGNAQEANKQNLEKQKDLMQAAKKEAQKSLDAEKEKYDAIKDNIKEYEDTLQLQRDIAKEQQQIQDKMYENLIAMSKIKVDLSIDTGDFERDWLDFENKFIKKIDDDDFLGKAKASAKELMSYFNSSQIQQTANQIRRIRNQIDIMERGGTSGIYGTNLAQAKEDLEDYMKQQMDDLQEVQDMIDDIKDNYLDTIDDAKDKMDDQIDQYERVNDLINHNVKMVELLYGDKAYDSMQKYYNLQKTNNERELESLKKQQEYWQEKMDNELVGSDAWKKFKENLDDVTDNLNDKLEDMIDNLADQFQNRLNGIIARLNNALTHGRGLDFLDQQWDYINNFDDQFLDVFQSKTGIDEIERLYQSTIDELASSPKSQKALNKLMNDQLKLLKQKDNLTQYDLQRAKASLEVEKARLAIEEARDNRTKMRLRRDSQGNYTYQYVADQEKLGQLQDALADAQANLYNTDKQHYKQNLNNLYDAYKDYIQKMKDLTEEYNKTQDEEERKRIQNRIDLLKDSTAKLMNGLTQDNKYLLDYLNESFFGGMGIDVSVLTMQEQMEIMKQSIPQMESQIQDLSDTIVSQGGIIPATIDMIKEIDKATKEYDQDVRDMLETTGTSLENIEEAIDEEGNFLDKNIINAQNLITVNDQLINSCRAQIQAIEQLLDYMDQYLNKVMNVEQLLSNLRRAYDTGQSLNGSNLTADEIGMTDWGMDTTKGMQYTGNPKLDAAAVKKQIDALMSEYERFLTSMTIATFDTGGYTGTWDDAEGRLAFLHQGELVLNQDDTRNILTAVQTVRAITNALSGAANSELGSIMSNVSGFLGNLNRNEQLDQNVHIEANFPNVTQHTEIEQAFENLVNMASMRASRYKD